MALLCSGNRTITSPTRRRMIGTSGRLRRCLPRWPTAGCGGRGKAVGGGSGIVAAGGRRSYIHPRLVFSVLFAERHCLRKVACCVVVHVDHACQEKYTHTHTHTKQNKARSEE